MQFEYLASVIVPIYNVELYLAACLDSLAAQTIDPKLMEVVMVNDGTPDSSGEIAKAYAEKYENFFYYEKTNGGLSSARNFGIDKARGKYFFFLDSDDKLTPPTVKEVTAFFEKHYDEIDAVSYFEQPYINGKKLGVHYRYRRYMRKNGIYDLYKLPYIKQTRVNVCVKNLLEENIYFDETPGFIQEDQEYNNRLLMRKMKIGYCKDGCYLYNRNNDGGIVSQRFHAYYLFEKSTAYFEQLFSYFEDSVPWYFQNMFLHDVDWKLEKNMLYPYHYDEEAFAVAMERMKKLLARVDVEMIQNNPHINPRRRQYWMDLKPDTTFIPYVDKTHNAVLCNGIMTAKSSDMNIELVRVQQNDDGTVRFRACLRTLFYDHMEEEPDIFCVENGDVQNAKRMDVYLSKFGHLDNGVRINRFFAFEYDIDPAKVHSFYHEVRFGGFTIPVRYTFSAQATFRHQVRLYTLVKGNTCLTFDKNRFLVSYVTDEEAEKIMKKQTASIFTPLWAKSLRNSAMALRKKEEIWLYSDLYTVRLDNGYYQFIHDFEKKDGVKRYYICTRPIDQVKDLFTPEMQEYLVPFGSRQHKILYLAAKYIFSAFYGRSPISPFPGEREERLFYDMEQFRVFYLQHGVLHASLYVQNSAENARADKIVVSSPFELDNYTTKYHYRKGDLVPSGMARYDHIDKNHAPCGKILYAPSWRSYLTQEQGPSHWDVAKNKITGSEYYKNMRAFLESKELAELLEKANLVLEVKLHPIIASATDLFTFATDRIQYAASEVNVADYDIFITDFSSFVFDYAYLNRPILYFVSDFDPFRSGMGHYRELDLPFEKAFGPLAKTGEEAVAALEKMVANGCKPESVYAERMENFYLPMESGAAAGLYDYIKNTLGK